MGGWRDWIEEHWAGAGMLASIVGALVISVVLMVGYNVIVTRPERANRDRVDAAPAGQPHALAGHRSSRVLIP